MSEHTPISAKDLQASWLKNSQSESSMVSEITSAYAHALDPVISYEDRLTREVAELREGADLFLKWVESGNEI